LDVTLGVSNTAVLGKLAQSSVQWQSLITTLMLSQLQWEVRQTQWSDLRGDRTFGFGYRVVTGPTTNSVVLDRAHWQHAIAISLMLGLGNATN